MVNRTISIVIFATVAALACILTFEKSDTSRLISLNLCINQIEDKNPILSIGPSLYDPLQDKYVDFIGLDQISFPHAFNHFQIGQTQGTSITTSPFFDDEGAELQFSQVSFDDATSSINTNNTNVGNIRSITKLGKYQIIVHQNIASKNLNYQHSTTIVHSEGAQLSLQHEWVGGAVQTILDERSGNLFIVGNLLNEATSVMSILVTDDEMEVQELEVLEFQADRAFFDFETSSLLYWRGGLAPQVGLKQINLQRNRKLPRFNSTILKASLTSFDEHTFETYNFETSALEVHDYFGKKEIQTNTDKGCSDTSKIDVHQIGKTSILKPSAQADKRSETLVIMLDGGPAFKQSALLPEKISLLNTGRSILSSDYPGSWGYGREYLNHITDKDYNTWAGKVCAVIAEERQNYQEIILRAYSFGAFPTSFLISKCGYMIDNFLYVAPALGLEDYLTNEEIWKGTQFDPVIQRLIDYRLDELEERLIQSLSEIDNSKVKFIIGKNDDRISIDYLKNVTSKLNITLTVLEKMTHSIHPDRAYISAAYEDL